MSTIKIEKVRKDIEEVGWKLISDKYINLKTDLQVKCPEGHDCFISFEKFRKGYECPICKQNQYYKSDNIAIKKNGYRILAFDQASITSGWAVFDDETLIKYGSYTSNEVDSTSRIAQTKCWIASMIDKWKPDQVILEDIQLQKVDGQNESVLVFKKLAHLQGVISNYLYEKSIDFLIVPAATWRAYSEIKGKSRSDKKKNAQLKIKRFYDVSVTQDEADAILIGRWAVDQKRAKKIIEF